MTTPTRLVLAAGAVVAIWLALDLLLLIFTGVLLAVFLRALASTVAGFTGLSVRWALAVVLLALLALVGAGGWLYAPRLAEQSDQLTRTLPRAFSDMTSWLRQYSWGEWILRETPSSVPEAADVVQPGRAASGVMHGAVGVLVVLFTGIYLAADPVPYLRGLLRLVPPRRRRRVAETLYAAAHVLRRWLVGQAAAMLVVGVAMGVGLGIIGVQLALLLGVLAGLFEFIPVLGPMLALGPALLLALADGTRTAVYVLLLYGVVQTAESYVLTPLVQRRAVELPPVLTISAQVGLGWAAGSLGLLVAVPLVAVVMVAVQMLYVEDALRDRIGNDVEAAARREVERDGKGPLDGLLSHA